MGTCLSAAVQLHYEATADGRREGWETVATFEFNKDYALSARLYHLQSREQRGRADEWWPYEASELGYDRQTFKAEELPADVASIYDPAELEEGFGSRYFALLDVCTRLGPSRVRVLFWRD